MTNRKSSQAAYRAVISDMCNLKWRPLARDGLIDVAWAYYYFSTHFRECMEAALERYPEDEKLVELDHGERDTDNLSPWPGVAEARRETGSRGVHAPDLTLTPIAGGQTRKASGAGQRVSGESACGR